MNRQLERNEADMGQGAQRYQAADQELSNLKAKNRELQNTGVVTKIKNFVKEKIWKPIKSLFGF